jgi:hypothetical protein
MQDAMLDGMRIALRIARDHGLKGLLGAIDVRISALRGKEE